MTEIAGWVSPKYASNNILNNVIKKVIGPEAKERACNRNSNGLQYQNHSGM